MGAGLFLGLMLSSLAVAGPPSPLTGDIELTDAVRNRGYSIVPLACARHDGSTVVLWQSRGHNGNPDAWTLRGRFYDAAGQALGQEFVHALANPGDFYLEALTCATDGSFLASGPADPRFVDREGFQVLPFNAAGQVAGSIASLHETDEFYRLLYSIAGLGNSGYLMTWLENRSTPQSIQFGRLLAQRLDALGQPVGASFELGSETELQRIEYPLLAGNTSGNLVRVWVDSVYNPNNGLLNCQILAQYLDVSGQPTGSPIVVRPGSAEESHIVPNPSVSRAEDGGFAVTWDRDPRQGASQIFVRSFDPTGAPRTDTLKVDTWSPESHGSDPTVAAFDGGQFVVAWQQNAKCARAEDRQCAGYGFQPCTVCVDLFDTTDGQDGSVVAQKFDSDGTRDGRLLPVSSETALTQFQSQLTANPLGHFLVVWANRDQLRSLAGPDALRFFSLSGPEEPNQPETTEIQLNAEYYNGQSRPSVACTTSGGFVGVWQGWRSDLERVGILGRIHDAQGNPISTELSLGDTTMIESEPVVARTPDGGFSVVWETAKVSQPGSINLSLRRFDASGEPLGAPSRVNTLFRGIQSTAALAADAQGRLLAAWQSENQDGSGWGIYAQRFDAAGRKLGREFRVNTQTRGDQQSPAACLSANGSAVVVWQGPDGKGSGIFAQRYNATGLPVGKETLINKMTLGNQRFPAVACRADGAFTVLWSTETQDGNDMDLVMRRYSVKGKALGPERLVHSSRPGAQIHATATYDAQGRLQVAWENRLPGGERTTLFTRGFNAVGQPRSAEFQLTEGKSVAQVDPAICAQPDGTPVVLWQDGQSLTFGEFDINSWGIFGRILGQN